MKKADIFHLLGFNSIKNLPAMQEMLVRPLGQEDPLEKEMATHSSLLAWRIPRTEDLGGLQSMGSQRVRHDLATITHNSIKGLKTLLCVSFAVEPGPCPKAALTSAPLLSAFHPFPSWVSNCSNLPFGT